MAFVRYDQYGITENIVDRVVNGTVIKYKAAFLHMLYDVEELRVAVKIRMTPYASGDNGEYGEELTTIPGISSFDKVLVANFDSIIDLSTGELLSAGLLGDDNNWNEGGPLYGKDVMYEFEYYRMIAATQPAIIDQLIMMVIQRANSEGTLFSM